TGGDLEVRAARPLDGETAAALADLRAKGASVVSVRELLAMARGADGRALLVELKAPGAGYPLYGRLETAPPAPLAALLAEGGAGRARGHGAPDRRPRRARGVVRRGPAGTPALLLAACELSRPRRPREPPRGRHRRGLVGGHVRPAPGADDRDPESARRRLPHRARHVSLADADGRRRRERRRRRPRHRAPARAHPSPRRPRAVHAGGARRAAHARARRPHGRADDVPLRALAAPRRAHGAAESDPEGRGGGRPRPRPAPVGGGAAGGGGAGRARALAGRLGHAPP